MGATNGHVITMQDTDYSSGRMFRDIPVDILRGLAITIMIGANIIPFLLAPPVPFWVRMIASIAAPLFIFLSGMMVALSCHTKYRTFSYFAIKGILIICIASAIDLIAWGYLPFTGMDVLYLIGFSLPIVYLVLSLPSEGRLAVFLGIFIASPVLRELLGYTALPLQIPVSSLLTGAVGLPSVADVLSQWLISGWFPVFPWLAIALLGAEAGAFRWHRRTITSFARRDFASLAGGALLLGFVFWYMMPVPTLIRSGYVELFYPPEPEFLFFMVSAIFCLFIIADLLPGENRFLDPIRAMGECSLAMYIIHITLIAVIIAPWNLEVPLVQFLAVYLLFVLVMVFIAYALRKMRRGIRNPSFVVRVLIGG